MIVTDDEISTFLSDEHPLKALDSIDVTEDGIVMLVIVVQSLNEHPIWMPFCCNNKQTISC